MPGSSPETACPDEHQSLLPQSSPSTPANHDATLKATELFGYSLMALAALAKATRATIFHVSEVVFDFPPSTVLNLSAIVFTILSAAYVHFTKILVQTQLTRKEFLQLSARGLFAACTLYLDNVALSRIPVGTALTIFSTTPAITSVFAAIFLHDPLSFTDVVILFVNLFGVILVSQPTGSGMHPGALLGVLAAVGAATSASAGFTLLKKMGTRVHFMLNMLAIGIGCIVLSVVVTSASQFAMLWRQMPSTLLPFSGAAVAFITQSLVNRGMQICRPGPALVVRSFAIPISFIFGLIFLNERVSRVAILGVLLVLASVAYIGITQFVRERPFQSRDEVQPKTTSQVV